MKNILFLLRKVSAASASFHGCISMHLDIGNHFLFFFFKWFYFFILTVLGHCCGEGMSPASGGYVLVWCSVFSLQRLLLLGTAGTSPLAVVVVHGLSCPSACRVFPDHIFWAEYGPDLICDLKRSPWLHMEAGVETGNLWEGLAVDMRPWCRASFHILICPLYIFLDVSRSFTHFKNWVVCFLIVEF